MALRNMAGLARARADASITDGRRRIAVLVADAPGTTGRPRGGRRGAAHRSDDPVWPRRSPRPPSEAMR